MAYVPKYEEEFKKNLVALLNHSVVHYHGKVAVAVANHMLKTGLALLHHGDLYCSTKGDNFEKLKQKLAGYELSALIHYLPQ